MKSLKSIAVVIGAGIFLAISCKKEFDHPPLKTVNDGAQVNITQLKARAAASSSSYKFGAGDTSLHCTVIADESSGNIYKQVFVKDNFGGAIQLNLVNSGGLASGDKIRVNLNSLYVVNQNSMIYIDSVDVGKNVVKLSSGNPVTPKAVSMAEVLAGTVPTNSNSLQSQLVQLTDVEFVEKGKPFADAIGKASVNRILKGCNSTTTLTVRTSGYANFAAKLTPEGNGTLIAVITQYNNTMQLTIRDYNEVMLTGPGCALPPPPSFTLAAPVASLNENFSSITATNQEYTNNGWMNWAEIGTVKWKTNINGTAKALKASSFSSPDASNVMWVISPPIIYNNALTLSFKTAFNYWDAGHPNAITAYVSTNFNGNNVNSANWTQVTGAVYTNGTGGFYPNSTTNSGTITLSSMPIFNGYSGNFFVAFRYSGNQQYNSDLYVDDVIVQ